MCDLNPNIPNQAASTSTSTSDATAANQENQITLAEAANTRLQNMERYLNSLNGGGNGCKYQGSEDATLSAQAITKVVINADAVLSSLKGTGGVNLLTAYNLAGKTLKTGMVIIPQSNSLYITDLAFTSGSAVAYY